MTTFDELLGDRQSHPEAAVRDLFGPREIVTARAPGRLDAMGGIADYSGSLVLQWPIRESTHVAVQLSTDRQLRLVSISSDSGTRVCDVPLEVLIRDGHAQSYAAARQWFRAAPDRLWAAYVAGAWLVLMRERGVHIDRGARVLIQSDVPEGKGLSSSAALEVASMRALSTALGVDVPSSGIALLCQKVENLVVGAPCGVMDQMASACGEAGALMALLCQPADFQGTVPLPSSLALWGIDSGVRHAVTGADYESVRVGAFMGYRILADLAGLAVTPGERTGLVRIDDPRWHGYLANVTAEEYYAFEPGLPSTITGAAFLERYGGTTNPVTSVEPERTYAVRAPTRHPIFEHGRVVKWRDRLRAAAAIEHVSDRDLVALGGLLGSRMYESHESYTACGLGTVATDLLVWRARYAGPSRGIFGARITGGGSGGTVALLTRADAGDVVAEIAAAFREQTGRGGRVLGSH